MAEVFGEGCEPLSDAYLDSLLAREDFWAAAAFAGDELVGGLTAHTLPVTRAESAEVFIYDIAVHADHQRRGVGRKLVMLLREEAARAGIETLFVRQTTKTNTRSTSTGHWEEPRRRSPFSRSRATGRDPLPEPGREIAVHWGDPQPHGAVRRTMSLRVGRTRRCGGVTWPAGTRWRYVLLDVVEALHAAGMLPGAAHAGLQQALTNVCDAIHLLGHQKRDAERQLALASEGKAQP